GCPSAKNDAAPSKILQTNQRIVEPQQINIGNLFMGPDPRARRRAHMRISISLYESLYPIDSLRNLRMRGATPKRESNLMDCLDALAVLLAYGMP
ncbi:MAG: hypothetical protein ACK5QX_05925, partial [bacterium]